MMDYARITAEDLVGRQVMIHMHTPAFTDLNLQGFQSPRFRAVVLGMDNLGLWIEHPEYKIMPVYNDEGEYIPPGERAEETHRAAILLFWGTIKTIILFPDKEAILPTEDVPVIGFQHVRDVERRLDEEETDLQPEPEPPPAPKKKTRKKK
jgi:hypothetical protein